MSKVGIYSGTFDPFHDGHKAFIEAVTDQMNLSKVYVLAEETPWRKENVTDITHRQAMIKLSLADNSKIHTSFEGTPKTHEVKTFLKLLSSKHPNESIVMLMGADVFLNIDKWQDFDELTKVAEFAVALRTEDDGEELVYKMMEIPQARVTKFATDQATVSSSSIRAQLQAGETPKGLNPKVLNYIKQNNLYYSSFRT